MAIAAFATPNQNNQFVAPIADHAAMSTPPEEIAQTRIRSFSMLLTVSCAENASIQLQGRDWPKPLRNQRAEDDDPEFS